MSLEAAKNRLTKVVRVVFEDRIVKACNEDSIYRLADVYVETRGIGLESMFEEVDFDAVTRGEKKVNQGELEELFRSERRKFEAEFIKKHLIDLDGGIFAEWIAGEAALEAVQNPDLEENRKLMEALGADTSIKGIKIIEY